MKIKIIILFFVMVNGFSQTIKSQDYYEGTLGDLKIEMYFKLQENGCPTNYAEVIYKYKSNSENEWLLLSTTLNNKEDQFTMVEFYNTGILLLKKKNNKLEGFWISPDGSKKLKIKLDKVKINKTKLKALEDALEKENYEANDC